MKAKFEKLDFEENGTITGLKAPTAATDAATKAYVDDSHVYLDEAVTGDYAGVKYVLTMIDGEPFMKVVEV